MNELLEWYNKFSKTNIAIVTGDISQLAVIDVGDLTLLPGLKEKVPEIRRTTRVKTGRGYHFYFSLQAEYIKRTDRLFGKKLELKSNGRYVIAPPSIIRDHQYLFEIPLREILPLPKVLSKRQDQSTVYDKKRNNSFKIPRYHGKKVDCIRQILQRDLKKGERNNGLFILYNLLLQNKNSKKYAMKIVEKKNSSLSNSLTELELKKIYLKTYHYGCSGIRGKLPYVRCENCSYRFKGGQFKINNILIQNLRLLPDLTNTQRGIVCLLGTVFDGEYPSIYKIAKTAKMNSATVKKAIKVLKEKNIIDNFLYN